MVAQCLNQPTFPLPTPSGRNDQGSAGKLRLSKVKALKTSEVAVNVTGAGAQRTQGDYDFASIQLAATHFLGEPSEVIRQAILRTMEGHQRQILGSLTGARFLQRLSALQIHLSALPKI